MLETLFTVMDLIGTFAFALSGARLVDRNQKHAMLRAFVPAFLTAFGGGLTRDLILLRRTPAILSSQNALAVLFATYLLYILLNRFRLTEILCSRHVDAALVAADAMGVAAFIRAGADGALSCRAGLAAGIVAGVMTAIGGGMWASLAVGKRPAEILTAVPLYRVIVVFNAVLYACGRMVSARQSLLAVLAVSCLVLCCFCGRINAYWRRLTAGVADAAYHGKVRRMFSGSQTRDILNPLRGVSRYSVFVIYGGKWKIRRFVYGCRRVMSA